MPTNPPCWPNDPDWLDGRLELSVPPSISLEAYWDADIIDAYGKPPGTIIRVTDPFDVRFRVELVGELWGCMCGNWCFDVCFTPIGKGIGFNLSEKLPAGVFDLNDWKGCDTRCIELPYTVPPRTVPAEACGTLYEVGARFALHCCDGSRPALVGYEALEEYEFY